MAYFNGSYEENKACGMFYNGIANFEFRISEGNAEKQGTWGIENGFKHEIAMIDGSVRFANIKKTVAYVCTGIDDDTNEPVVEKWSIKHIWLKINL